MPEPEQLITDNLDIWTSAAQMKSASGRGKSNKLELYGIEKLRELILKLAVRGLLVPQYPNEEPASELLKKIAAEKAQLVKDKKIKKPKALPTIKDDEKPFGIAEGWSWLRLPEAYYVISPGKKKLKSSEIQEEGKYPVIDQGQEHVSGFSNDGSMVIEILHPLVVFGDHTRNIKYIDFDFVPGADGTKILCPYLILPRYFYTYLRHYDLEGRGYARHFKVLNENLIAIPPLEEQNRIVAKVDELMALFDQLEQQQETSITAHQTLVQTLLDALTTVSDRDGFAAAWARIADHFDTLFTTEWSIDQLKQTILQLAVMGKLVPQDPNDEPASELLKRIAAEKVQLVKDGKLKKQKGLPPTADSEKSFELPEGWEWVRILDFAVVGTGATPSRDKSSYYEPQDFNWVTSGETSNDFVFETKEFVSAKAVEKTNVSIYPVGTLIVAMYGQGKTRGQITELMIEAGTNQACAAIQLVEATAHHRGFIKLFFKKAYEELRSLAEGGAQPNLNVGKISQTVVPMPPLNEQRRIVAKADELLAIADELKQKILRKNQLALALADVAVKGFGSRKIEEAGVMKDSPDNQKADKDKGPKRTPSDNQKFVLRRFHISTGYRSLPDTDCEFHAENELPEESEPVCLVGLNGSGKSNLIEAVADVFCYLEMINLPWGALKSASSKYRKNDHKFEVEYTISTAKSASHVAIEKTKKNVADFFTVGDDGEKTKVEDPEERLALLPRRIVGYSSGLNETLSHPFLRTRTLYSEEVALAAPDVGQDLSQSKIVFDTNTLYMDYENNAEILLCNYIFRSSGELAFFNEFTRVKGVESFELKFNRKIAGKSSDNIARITDELDSYIRKFASCAGQSYEPKQNEHRFHFKLTEKVKKKFRKEFETAENLFLAMYKWSLLNALVLSKDQRKIFIREDVTTGTLERPPVVPSKDRLFDVAEVKVKLSTPNKVIDYSGLSDGEHQFIQVFGTVLLFNEPGSLFLLDEPESHFNPEWRTKFNNVLNGIPNADTHEFIISTHSPYIVSGSKGTNVYKFTRNGSEVECQQVDFETYGASFDVLLKKLFSIDSLIDESAREELETIVQSGDLEQMEEAVGDFAESREKRRLYEAIIKKQSEGA